MREYYREYQRKWHEKKKDATLMRMYGITKDDYDRMVIEQDGRCAICNRTEGTLVIDHCHEKGHVRALLCNKCNLGLGLFGDSPDLLVSAAMYLVSTDKSARSESEVPK